MSPAIGSSDLDVGNSRLWLAALISVEYAEQLRSAYEAEVGRSLETYFDLYRLARFGDHWKTLNPQLTGTPVDEGTFAAMADRRNPDGT